MLLVLTAATLSVPAAAQRPASDCTPATAGQVHEIRSGMCVRSTIDARDPKNENDVPYEDWRLPLAAGESVQIDLDSLAPPRPAPAADQPAAAGAAAPAPESAFPFDTYLELRRAGAVEPLEVNDDRPGSLNSTIRFTATAAGDYVIRARPLFGGDGDYTLRVAPPPPPVVPVALVPGRNEVRPPEQGGGALQERLFAFDGRRGERVRLTLARRGFGDQLRLLGPDGEALAAAGEFDETVSIFAILPRDGTYRVEARLHDFGPNREPSTLDLEKVAAVADRPPTPLRIGAVADGEISTQSPADADVFGGSTLRLHELYELRVTAGQPVTVLLDSTAFDPVLDAGAMSALGFAIALTDDDSGEGLNSRLVLRPTRSGSIVLRVRALANRRGAFRLRVVPGESPATAQ